MGNAEAKLLKPSMDNMSACQCNENSTSSISVIRFRFHFHATIMQTLFSHTGLGKSIYLAGSWDNWEKKLEMMKIDDQFVANVTLKEGTHEFKFLIDGKWQCDEHFKLVPNDYGTKNNQFEVRANRDAKLVGKFVTIIKVDDDGASEDCNLEDKENHAAIAEIQDYMAEESQQENKLMASSETQEQPMVQLQPSVKEKLLDHPNQLPAPKPLQKQYPYRGIALQQGRANHQLFAVANLENGRLYFGMDFSREGAKLVCFFQFRQSGQEMKNQLQFLFQFLEVKEMPENITQRLWKIADDQYAYLVEFSAVSIHIHFTPNRDRECDLIMKKFICNAEVNWIDICNGVLPTLFSNSEKIDKTKINEDTSQKPEVPQVIANAFGLTIEGRCKVGCAAVKLVKEICVTPAANGFVGNLFIQACEEVQTACETSNASGKIEEKKENEKEKVEPFNVVMEGYLQMKRIVVDIGPNADCTVNIDSPISERFCIGSNDKKPKHLTIVKVTNKCNEMVAYCKEISGKGKGTLPWSLIKCTWKAIFEHLQRISTSEEAEASGMVLLCPKESLYIDAEEMHLQSVYIQTTKTVCFKVNWRYILACVLKTVQLEKIGYGKDEKCFVEICNHRHELNPIAVPFLNFHLPNLFSLTKEDVKSHLWKVGLHALPMLLRNAGDYLGRLTQDPRTKAMLDRLDQFGDLIKAATGIYYLLKSLIAFAATFLDLGTSKMKMGEAWEEFRNESKQIWKDRDGVLSTSIAFLKLFWTTTKKFCGAVGAAFSTRQWDRFTHLRVMEQALHLLKPYIIAWIDKHSRKRITPMTQGPAVKQSPTDQCTAEELSPWNRMKGILKEPQDLAQIGRKFIDVTGDVLGCSSSNWSLVNVGVDDFSWGFIRNDFCGINFGIQGGSCGFINDEVCLVKCGRVLPSAFSLITKVTIWNFERPVWKKWKHLAFDYQYRTFPIEKLIGTPLGSGRWDPAGVVTMFNQDVSCRYVDSTSAGNSLFGVINCQASEYFRVKNCRKKNLVVDSKCVDLQGTEIDNAQLFCDEINITDDNQFKKLIIIDATGVVSQHQFDTFFHMSAAGRIQDFFYLSSPKSTELLVPRVFVQNTMIIDVGGCSLAPPSNENIFGGKEIIIKSESGTFAIDNAHLRGTIGIMAEYIMIRQTTGEMENVTLIAKRDMTLANSTLNCRDSLCRQTLEGDMHDSDSKTSSNKNVILCGGNYKAENSQHIGGKEGLYREVEGHSSLTEVDFISDATQIHHLKGGEDIHCPIEKTKTKRKKKSLFKKKTTTKEKLQFLRSSYETKEGQTVIFKDNEMNSASTLFNAKEGTIIAGSGDLNLRNTVATRKTMTTRSFCGIRTGKKKKKVQDSNPCHFESKPGAHSALEGDSVYMHDTTAYCPQAMFEVIARNEIIWSRSLQTKKVTEWRLLPRMSFPILKDAKKLAKGRIGHFLKNSNTADFVRNMKKSNRFEKIPTAIFDNSYVVRNVHDAITGAQNLRHGEFKEAGRKAASVTNLGSTPLVEVTTVQRKKKDLHKPGKNGWFAVGFLSMEAQKGQFVGGVRGYADGARMKFGHLVVTAGKRTMKRKEKDVALGAKWNALYAKGTSTTSKSSENIPTALHFGEWYPEIDVMEMTNSVVFADKAIGRIDHLDQQWQMDSYSTKTKTATVTQDFVGNPPQVSGSKTSNIVRSTTMEPMGLQVKDSRNFRLGTTSELKPLVGKKKTSQMSFGSGLGPNQPASCGYEMSRKRFKYIKKGNGLKQKQISSRKHYVGPKFSTNLLTAPFEKTKSTTFADMPESVQVYLKMYANENDVAYNKLDDAGRERKWQSMIDNCDDPVSKNYLQENIDMDRTLSNEMMLVLRDKHTGDKIMALPGTQSLWDVLIDLLIPAKIKETPEFSNALEMYKKLRKEDPNGRIVIIGHSKSGFEVEMLGATAKDPNLMVISFNPACPSIFGPPLQDNNFGPSTVYRCLCKGDVSACISGPLGEFSRKVAMPHGRKLMEVMWDCKDRVWSHQLVNFMDQKTTPPQPSDAADPSSSSKVTSAVPPLTSKDHLKRMRFK